MAETLVQPVMDALLTCFCAQLAANPNPPAQCCLRWGNSADALFGTLEDECCQGLAYVRLASVYPTGNAFPSPETDSPVNGCGVQAWAVQLEMGVFRCASVGTVETVPTCAEWTSLSTQMVLDVQAMRLAICCLQDLLDFDTGSMAVGAATPGPTDGACASISQSIQILLPQGSNCLEC